MIYYHKCHVKISKNIYNILCKKHQIKILWTKSKGCGQRTKICGRWRRWWGQCWKWGNPTSGATNPINSSFGYSILNTPCIYFKIYLPIIIHHISYIIIYHLVEEHRGLGGNIISRLDSGAFAGLIYSSLVLTD